MNSKTKCLKRWCKYIILIQIGFYFTIYTRVKFSIQPNVTPNILKILKYDRNVKPETRLLQSNVLTTSGNNSAQSANILYWTKWFSSRDIKKLITKNTFNECEVKCEVTFDKNLLNQSHGIIFHARDLKMNDFPSHLEHQVWILMDMESPKYSPNLTPFYNKGFNWTMSYRLDSDIYHPYGRLISRNKQIDPYNFTSQDLKESLKNRKMAAWLVSNCQTNGNREKYIKELQKFIKIEIYGKCGPLKCKEKESPTFNCLSFISSSYKFYMSFENSLCHDYITEKFFIPLAQNIVPVVYGGANYEHHAPKGSFINTRDFKSPEELSKYLLYLDSHDEEYLKYFEWKKELKSVLYPMDNKGPWCLLCKKVIEFKESLNNKSYEFPRKTYDIQKWWNFRPNSKLNACDN